MDAIDISYPSNGLPLDMNYAMVGVTRIRALMWYSKDCPAGFYGIPINHNSEPAALCVRCPKGTIKNFTGQLPNKNADKSCLPCPEGLYDLDGDAATECTPSDFHVDGFIRGQGDNEAYFLYVSVARARSRSRAPSPSTAPSRSSPLPLSCSFSPTLFAILPCPPLQ